MTNPAFTFKYNPEYTMSFEFQTEIKEGQQGREQRHPVRTYPKLTWSLSFDKNPEKRKEIEDFFISVNGAESLFDFTYDGVTYECWFEGDSFVQNYKDLGYGSFDLKISTIDRRQVVQVDELDFYHKAECEYSLDFYTLVDKVLTYQNNRKGYWQEPKRSWKLVFDKKPDVIKQLQEFFVAKRGRFRAFRWQWKKEHGGDDNFYDVRFDTDTLDFNMLDLGYGQCEVKIKEVFPNENPYGEYEKDEIIPRNLLKIELQDGNINILENETMQSLTYDGNEYLGAPLKVSEISKNDNQVVNKVNVTISNTALQISGIIGNRGDVITQANAVLTRVLLNVNTNQIIQGTGEVLWVGKCNNLKLGYEEATMDIETTLGGYELKCPVMNYRATCQVRAFKDIRCGYTGAETHCDRTWTRCNELGNQANFRGCISMPNEMVIRA